eukprot:CAMPEP_0171330326 /NCGR_PEP_ID=MMETSP0878-20121228/1934_1 /TAXON_ID=67004 /ORGANISM="Thalassiosira weissflogii, Strain CCMP1336" /LENGTH=161 /DNA_ID=CAMNT_0011830599 /DNA_START=177 /DNA_END=662 /DNA_ORIENTATION=+
MVQSIKIICVAAAVMINAVSAFTAPRPSSMWVPVQPRRLAPSPLPATSSSMSTVSGPATIDSPSIEAPQKRRRYDADEEHKMEEDKSILRIFNDSINTREYVSRCLVQVVGLSEDRAYETMMHAHEFGLAAVGKYATPTAQMLAERLCVSGVRADFVQTDE